MNNNYIDIILPLYKPNDKVYDAIESILMQTYKNWYLYIVDDASKDDSLQKIKNRYSAYSNNITFIELDQNRRAAACRNYGINNGNSRYIAFIDQDDIWLPTKLELQIEYFNKNDVDAVIGNVQLINNNGEIFLHHIWQKENQSRREIDWNLPNKDIAHKIFLKPNIRIISSILTRELYEIIGGFKDEFFGGEDETFWFEVALKGRIGFIDEVVFYRREHENNTVNKYKSVRRVGYIKSIKYLKHRYKDQIELPYDRKIHELSWELFKSNISNFKINVLLFSFIVLLKHPKLTIGKIKVSFKNL